MDSPKLHESSDLRTRPIWFTLVGIVVAAILIHILVYSFLIFLRHKIPAGPPVADAVPVSPEPRIQGIPIFHPTLPPEDLAKFHSMQQTRLTTYGPTTRPGFVHIPINRAMDIYLTRGTP